MVDLSLQNAFIVTKTSTSSSIISLITFSSELFSLTFRKSSLSLSLPSWMAFLKLTSIIRNQIILYFVLIKWNLQQGLHSFELLKFHDLPKLFWWLKFDNFLGNHFHFVSVVANWFVKKPNLICTFSQHHFPWLSITQLKFHNFVIVGLENETLKFHDFPGFFITDMNPVQYP